MVGISSLPIITSEDDEAVFGSRHTILEGAPLNSLDIEDLPSFERDSTQSLESAVVSAAADTEKRNNAITSEDVEAVFGSSHTILEGAPRNSLYIEDLLSVGRDSTQSLESAVISAAADSEKRINVIENRVVKPAMKTSASILKRALTGPSSNKSKWNRSMKKTKISGQSSALTDADGKPVTTTTTTVMERPLSPVLSGKRNLVSPQPGSSGVKPPKQRASPVVVEESTLECFSQQKDKDAVIGIVCLKNELEHRLIWETSSVVVLKEQEEQLKLRLVEIVRAREMVERDCAKTEKQLKQF